jgi:DHA1 family bicyclomycin/chloramphenicol resistance-like MFS transporter
MPARDRGIGLVIVLGALTAFGPMSIDMYLPAFPALAAHFHASQPQVQLTLTACLAGLALGQVFAGPLSDTLGRRRPLLVGLAGYTVASALCAFAPSSYLLTGLRFVQGLCGAAGLVISLAVVRDRYEGVAVARFFSALMLVNGLAPMLAPIIGGQLLRVTAWNGIFLVLTGYGLILIVTVAMALPETLPPHRRRPGHLGRVVRTFGELVRDRTFIGYALTRSLLFAAMFGYISGSAFVLQEIYGVSAQLYGVVFGVNALGLVLASQVNSRLLRRYPPRPLLAVALATSLLGGLGVLVAVGLPGHPLFWLLPPLFVVVAGLGVVMPNGTALALANHRDAAGTASALLGMVQFAGGALVAPLVGLGGTRTALPMAVVIAAASLLANLTLHTLTRSDRGGEPAGARDGAAERGGTGEVEQPIPAQG